jgi:multiple sugar transport system ATP-binding protein
MRVQMRREIAQLHSRLAATMIYVTHDQVEALTLGDRIAVMRGGTLQQVAGPMELYRRPANLFVAGFIGSPPMNFFHGTIVSDGGGLSFQEEAEPAGAAPGFKLRVDGEMSPRLAGFAGKKVVMGIRPEHIAEKTGARDAPAGQVIEALAGVVEPMGPETFLYAANGAHSFAARLRADFRVAAQQKVSLLFDMRQAHFFDPASEMAIAG